ncbi:MAG: hypothetical protein ONB46_01665 [candidate division KSB1 bacterium]|nr:hypothetical protein [candidate division KSB1 bacterium]MDZ7364374.1 hypothetical protein [candidate division KSB1 bacterium]MDZ7402746.1 hypothetical protein [candidate division KSB1 bacterium]
MSHTTWGSGFGISLLVAVHQSEAQAMRKNREKLGKSQAQNKTPLALARTSGVSALQTENAKLIGLRFTNDVYAYFNNSSRFVTR